MNFLTKKLTYTFCISTILENKKNFQHKICYKKKYSFLNLKHNTSQILATRILKKGNFLKVYKVIKKFYYIYILREKFKNIPLNSNYMFFYNKYQSFRDFDRVLLWKYKSLDCMFSVKTRKTIKKKKKKFSINLLFVNGLRRTLLCINIIKYLILMNKKRKKKNLKYEYFTPLYQFLTNDKNNSVIKLKFKIYKQKLMQLQS